MLTSEQSAAIREMSERLGGSPILDLVATSLGPHEKPAARTETLRARAAIQVMDGDADWAREHLRWRDGAPLLDLANVVRILERHPDYAGRYTFLKGMDKVCDFRRVMLAWQIDELAAIVQERFLPGVAEETVRRGLLVVANRNSMGPSE